MFGRLFLCICIYIYIFSNALFDSRLLPPRRIIFVGLEILKNTIAWRKKLSILRRRDCNIYNIYLSIVYFYIFISRHHYIGTFLLCREWCKKELKCLRQLFVLFLYFFHFLFFLPFIFSWFFLLLDLLILENYVSEIDSP